MASATDLVVKAADGTTNVTYSVVTGSGGDKAPAVWRNNGASGSFGQRPELRFTTQTSGDKLSRRVIGEYTFPAVYTDSTSGLTKVAKRANVRVEAAVPSEGMTDAQLAEFAAQFANLFATTLIKGAMASGFAPT